MTSGHGYDPATMQVSATVITRDGDRVDVDLGDSIEPGMTVERVAAEVATTDWFEPVASLTVEFVDRVSYRSVATATFTYSLNED